MRRPISKLVVLLLICLLAAAVSARAQAAEPFLWPEPQRAFLQDGPGLLLSKEQRERFLALDAAGRDRFIAEFLGEDPVPETRDNELALGVERRRTLAALEYLSPGDVRSQLLFLNGPPAERKVIDCGTAFKPLEIWTYRGGLGEEGESRERKAVVYRPKPSEPFRFWMPADSKRVLYTPEMENVMEQLETYGARAGRLRRLDLLVCKDARLVDLATGIEGLLGNRSPRAAGRRRTYGLRPWAGSGAEGGESFLDPPGDLAFWAREAAKTELPEGPQELELGSVLIDFPSLERQRMITRGLVTVPAAQLQTTAGDKGDEHRLLIEGLVEQPDGIFEDFRVRFKIPPAKDGGLVALAFERQLRPGLAFLLRLRIKDELSGAEALLARGFKVPRLPEPSPEWAALAGRAATGEEVRLALQTADSLVLLPPVEEVVFGLWRAEALVTGERIQRVTFLLDGKAQLSRTSPPFTAEIRLPATPAEAVVRAEGYDAEGKLVAADEVVLNRPREAFRIEIKEPAEGNVVAGQTIARAEVVVPEGRQVEKVDFSLNDRPVATLTQPPWQTAVDIPDEAIVYLTVAATLDNGERLEEVRFLRAPENLEHVDVQLIELFTTVTDRSGQVVPGLTAGDFQVLEEGKPQALVRFELVENLPLTVGLVLDTSGSMESSLAEAQEAAADFLKKVVKPRDRAFAMRFAGRPELLIAPTDDIEAVAESLRHFQAVGMTSLHDAIVSSLHYFRSTKGQRALVLLSDGDDTASDVSFEDALEYARRSGVSIYTIGLNISLIQGGNARGKLARLAETTGGRSFFIEKAEQLAGIYGQIEQELRSRYLLAFQTERPAGRSVYRQIEVRVSKPGLKARTARGYYP